MIDLHSHILPGVDDGAKTFDDSLKMLRECESQLITDIILTPHYFPERGYTNTVLENQKIFRELKSRAAEQGIKLNLFLGNEIYLSPDLVEQIYQSKIKPLADSNFLLVELPFSGKFPHYEDIFRALLRAGWRVVLAHPERYASIQQDYQIALDLYNMGVLFQCNLFSLNGAYGKEAKKLVNYLAAEHLIFGFGTDIHRPHRDKRISRAQGRLLKYYAPHELDQLLDRNALIIINTSTH